MRLSVFAKEELATGAMLGSSSAPRLVAATSNVPSHALAPVLLSFPMPLGATVALVLSSYRQAALSSLLCLLSARGKLQQASTLSINETL